MMTTPAKTKPMHLVFSALGGLVLLFIVAPLAGMLIHCSPSELAGTAADPEVQRSIGLSLWTSMAATVIFGMAAIPFAYVLARKRFPLKRLVTGIIEIPTVIPHCAAGIAILGVVSRESLAGKAAASLGFHFVSGPAGIMAAMAFVSIPYLINSARDGFHAVPERLEKVALNLGASPIRVFFTVSVPLAWRAILSGLILMWARGMSEFGAVVIVAYRPMTAPVLIYERFGAFGLKEARAISVVFVADCLVFCIMLRLLAGTRENAAR